MQMPLGSGVTRPRYQAIDIARGVAILAMAIYHFAWDLSYFRLIGVDVSAEPAWFVFARSILASFMLLVGIGLVLAHGNGIRWRAFRRRLAFVVLGAVLITIATVFLFPESYVYFGVLHAIALFSLLALPFLFAPLWQVFFVALLFIVPPLVYANEAFNERILSWIGFWVVPPYTNDLVPIFPWFGVVLLGVGIMRLVRASALATRLAAWRSDSRLARGFAFAGRWSLLIYLLHQPILFGIVYPVAQVLAPPDQVRAADFRASCQASCTVGGRTEAMCQTYCGCALERIETGHLWEAVTAAQTTPAQQQALADVTLQCSTPVDDPVFSTTP